MPTTTTSTTIATSVAATLENLQTNYGPAAQAVGQSFSSAYDAHLILLQILSVMISAAFIGGIVYFIIETGWLRIRMERIQDVVLKTDVSKKRVQASWDDIEAHFFAGDDNDLRVAIIEADTLLDDALRGAGIPGAQLGDRLKKVKTSQLPNVEEVWQAHKIRNRIAHESDFVLKRDLAEKALTVYEKALQSLGVLGGDQEKKPVVEEKPTEPQNH